MWLRSTEVQPVFLLLDLPPGDQRLWVERADTDCRQFLFPLPASPQLGVEWQGARDWLVNSPSRVGACSSARLFPLRHTLAEWPPRFP